MTVTVTHTTPADSSFSTTGAAAWNANHTLSGVGTMAEQDASAVAITGGTINGATVGATTPAAGTFTTLIGGSGSANYGQFTGGATTKAVEFKTLGSDSNVSFALQAKGTGAIDLAAGSSGVNISNGGTVTALTRTATGANNYTSIPTLAITAPTTAGGVQATATPTMYVGTATIQSGGTGYTLNDVITVSGGTFTSAATFTVSAVSGGVITGITLSSGGAGYSVLPTNPVSTTGGTGTGATLNITGYGLSTTFTITNAGSGYVEQPTVSFSGGGGGSGAAAYAVVGSGTVVKSIGSTMSFYTPGGEGFRVVDSGGSGNYWQAFGTAGSPDFRATASGTISSTGANSLFFRTGSTVNQFAVAHTASAVNYVQVTGAATGANVTISTQGSDASIFGTLLAKGSGGWDITGNGASTFRNAAGANQFRVTPTSSAVNLIQATGAVAGAAPSLSSIGSDTNIDLNLITKGTGVVQFGTYTASALLPVAGYITIKDSGGTTRRLLVG